MALSTKTFAQLVQDQAAAIQGRALQILDFTTGSVLRSFVEANAAVGMWLQAMALQILSVTRLSTSLGPDVDSWVADWGVSRLAATVSTGSVTFSRFAPASAVVIPIGAQVQTADGTQTFSVVLDATNASWSLAQNGYLLPINVASVTVPVQSTTGSTSANVGAGLVNVVLTSIVGVDTVTNLLPFTGGSNAESDAQLRARFALFIASLSKGTTGAIQYTIASLQLNLRSTIIEGISTDGSSSPGLLTITVDDGTGAPSSGLLGTVSAAVALVRPAGVTWAVLAPVVKQVNIACTINTAPGYDHNAVVAVVAAAITTFMKTVTLGNGLPFYRLAQVIYDASAGVVSIPSLTINGLTADIIANPRNSIQLVTLTVS